MDIKEILSKCDHTLLSQTATWEDIGAVIDDGIKFGVASVCIPPSYVRRAAKYADGRVKICTVIGFPNGYSTTKAKLFETEDALRSGADEIDMVVNIGEVKSGHFDAVRDEIKILINVGEGSGHAVAWGCDLTYDYVKINGDYRT